jgi:arabinan endo-1,5-alpha-L-arabinosidase
VVVPFDINSIQDDYAQLASADFVYSWASHNVHDPSILKEGDYYYCYSTDAAYGVSVRPGIQIRRSKDLVNWQFYGWVFSSIPSKGAQYIQQKGGVPNQGLWAPYVLKVGNEFRLYYSLSSTPKPRLSTIGLATAPTPVGPWTEQALVVSSTDDNTTQTNAIDPTVLVDPKTGRHWMYYGSAWDGIYILELNPATGLPLVGGTRGQRISQRGFTGGTPNGNIEGADIIYNAELNQYFLFIAYDWLQTKYNVRVARADQPEGPFYDFNGQDINIEVDHGPMILAPYQFKGHSGYQGVAHCTVFKENGDYYLASQARPVANSYFMNLHVRKLSWTPEGWPVASPQRYAGIGQQTGWTRDSLIGTWERIDFGYQVVPGYANEQVSPGLQVARDWMLEADGTVDGTSSTWEWDGSHLLVHQSDGSIEKLVVERGRDWENRRPCFVLSGLSADGTLIWGKK